MTDGSTGLQRLRTFDTDIDRMMAIYKQAAAVHDAARAAMGQGSAVQVSSTASTNVPIAPGPDIRRIAPLPRRRRQST